MPSIKISSPFSSRPPTLDQQPIRRPHVLVDTLAITNETAVKDGIDAPCRQRRDALFAGGNALLQHVPTILRQRVAQLIARADDRARQLLPVPTRAHDQRNGHSAHLVAAQDGRRYLALFQLRLAFAALSIGEAIAGQLITNNSEALLGCQAISRRVAQGIRHRIRKAGELREFFFVGVFSEGDGHFLPRPTNEGDPRLRRGGYGARGNFALASGQICRRQRNTGFDEYGYNEERQQTRHQRLPDPRPHHRPGRQVHAHHQRQIERQQRQAQVHELFHTPDHELAQVEDDREPIGCTNTPLQQGKNHEKHEGGAQHRQCCIQRRTEEVRAHPGQRADDGDRRPARRRFLEISLVADGRAGGHSGHRVLRTSSHQRVTRRKRLLTAFMIIEMLRLSTR